MKNSVIGFIFLVVSVISIESNAQVVKKTMKVFGACEQCKERIEKALAIKGVKNPIWDIESNMLTFEHDTTLVSIEKIENKIIGVGHDLVNKKAKDFIYNDLPACCHYREATESELPVYKGVVLQESMTGKFEPLQNASIYWLGTNKGVVTDSTGVFNIPASAMSHRLIISYVGYTSDTITVGSNTQLNVIMASKNQLKEVTIYSRPNGMFIPTFNAIRTQVMTGTELLKAACCNLSESFETNPSVDVSYNDAITGSKQIQLLGLSGNYTQLTIENLPGPRGLATPLGLNAIAGPWIESIQLTKGVGSVANGYESIAGQINVELKKPETAEKLLANVYVNDFGKVDLNLNVAQKINSKWTTALLLHDDVLNNAMDQNKDGFKELPTGNQFGLVNRYKYDNSKGILGQFGFKVFNDDKLGGQTSFNPNADKYTSNHYGVGIQTNRYEAFGKLGYVFPQQKYKSIGLQFAAIHHQQKSYFGYTNYNGEQKSVYGNLIYQSIINSTIHKFRTGLSFQLDDYDELLQSQVYKRRELVPGTFFEYTYTPNDQFGLVAGVRADDNSLYGSFVTPRVNMRYEPVKGTTIRFSAGKGQRTANVFAENNSVFASARILDLQMNPQVAGYGLLPEIAWNKGISLDQKLNLFEHTATLGFDYFRNDFQNQVIVDLENPRLVQIYNLKGKSYSNSIQTELNMQPLDRLDIRLAYRYFQVFQTYNGELLERPFIAKNRAFVSLDYATTNNWKFNYTITFNGKKRVTNTSANPSSLQLNAYSPSYTIMNAQVSKTFGKTHLNDLYVGMENITDFFQQSPILSADQPFGRYFDAALIWGPTTGRMLYMGWRLKIK